MRCSDQLTSKEAFVSTTFQDRESGTKCVDSPKLLSLSSRMQFANTNAVQEQMADSDYIQILRSASVPLLHLANRSMQNKAVWQHS